MQSLGDGVRTVARQLVALLGALFLRHVAIELKFRVARWAPGALAARRRLEYCRWADSQVGLANLW